MSTNFVQDIKDQHARFGVTEWVNFNCENKLLMTELLKHKMKFLHEELTETQTKGIDVGDAEEVVDGLIDLIVVALDTLIAFDVDAQLAWDSVYVANMSKEAGVKPERPNPLGLPDLIKPDGWVGPTHKGNHGLFGKAL